MRRASAATGKPPPAEHLLKNLRLLDLDEAFDLPPLDGSTFASSSPASLQTERIFAAQWVLYRLFERWDPAWTEANLAAYFPPLEPRQSAELKLLCYKRLSELKQEGHFARDVTVRRTMFDECKGPRFEELLTLFSTLVLARSISADGSVTSQTCAGLVPLKNYHRTPLVLAYQASLASALRARASAEARFLALGRALDARRRDLDERAVRIDEAGAPYRDRRRALPQRTLERLDREVRGSWAGEPEWADVALRSDRPRPRNDLLERPFTEVWALTRDDRLYTVRPDRNRSLLVQLEGRVAEQNARLRRWRAVSDRVIVQSEAMAAEGHGVETPPRPTPTKPAPLTEKAVADKTPPETPRLAHHPGAHMPALSPPQTRTLRRSSGHRHADPPRTPPRTAAAAAQPPDPSPAPASPRAAQASQIVSAVLQAAPTPAHRAAAPPLSLAERTRQSLAHLAPGPESSPAAAAPLRPAQIPEHSEPEPEPHTPERHASLAERTRQSMSLASSAARPALRRKSRMARMSNTYPVNQFETPRKVAPVGEVLEEESPDESLEEKLEELGVDEEEAFRSRPRVPATPPPPGMESGLRDESVLSVREATGQ